MSAMVGQLVQQVKLGLGGSSAQGSSDAILLQRFLDGNDADAFAELIVRHGRMVFGVCRRILTHHQDAEDAFQSVFLIMANKAATIEPKEQLPAWLYGVACRAAMKARSLRQKRATMAVPGSFDLPDPRGDESAEREQLELLDQELQRLPDKFRLPILLCDLLGQTRAVVARSLGWPEGTVAGRLAEGRKLLGKRLTKRGVALGLPFLTTAWIDSMALGQVPRELVHSTTHFVSLLKLSNDPAVVPQRVNELSKGIVKNMFVTKMQCLALGLIVAAGLSIGIHQLAAFSDEKAPKAAPPGTAKPNLDPINPHLLLEKPIQEELKLSSGQVDRVKDAFDKGSKQSKTLIDENKQLEAQMAELQKQIDKLNEKHASNQAKINKTQEETVKAALPDILSDRAIKRLREITIQQTSLAALLTDPKIQDQLKLTDEQYKKLKELNPERLAVWSTDVNSSWLLNTRASLDYSKVLFKTDISGLDKWAVRSSTSYLFLDLGHDQQLQQILTVDQREKLKKLTGEPYQPKSETPTRLDAAPGK